MTEDEYWESEEDEFGPAHSRPWGCCFGHCPSDFSVAFREYHGLEKSYQAYLASLEAERKYHWKKSQRKRPSKRGYHIKHTEFRLLVSSKELTAHMLPRYLRLQYFSKRRLKLSPQQKARIEEYLNDDSGFYKPYWEMFP